MARIDSYVQPQRLYRYRLFKNLDRELEAIREGYLFCALYKNLNDPMEGLFASGHLLREHKHFHEIREAIVSTKSQIGICSFSEVYDHELMWAHYASRFTGICVGYSLSRLLKNLGDDITFVRMYYNEKVPTVQRPHMEWACWLRWSSLTRTTDGFMSGNGGCLRHQARLDTMTSHV